MLKEVHTMFYSSDAACLRVFLCDKLGLKATDVGGGWLIFDISEADMAATRQMRRPGQYRARPISLFIAIISHRQ